MASLPQPPVGLCAACRHLRRIRNRRGSTFFLCQRGLDDPAFPRYPRLPVVQCSGYDPVHTDEE